MNAENLRRVVESTSRRTTSATNVGRKATSNETARKIGQDQSQDLLRRVDLEADPRVRDQRMERKDPERDQNPASLDPQNQNQAPDLLPRERKVRKGKRGARRPEINILTYLLL